MATNKVCIGDRVLLNDESKGQVRFIGSVSGKRNIYYGIALDKPNGKNDGFVNNIKYFDCDKDHGLFVNISKIQKSKGMLE